MAQGRRSRLIIRKVDPLSVLKFSVLLFIALYLVMVVAGVVLWGLASNAGIRGNIESLIGDLIASDEFTFKGGQLLRASVIGGAILVVSGTGASVLTAVLFNLISDLVGGIGISVEERVRRRDRGRTAEPGYDPPREQPREQPRAAPTSSLTDTSNVPRPSPRPTPRSSPRSRT